MHIDVTNEDSVIQAFKHVASASPTGRIDYFVNAAGVSDTLSIKMRMNTLKLINYIVCHDQYQAGGKYAARAV